MGIQEEVIRKTFKNELGEKRYIIAILLFSFGIAFYCISILVYWISIVLFYFSIYLRLIDSYANILKGISYSLFIQYI